MDLDCMVAKKVFGWTDIRIPPKNTDPVAIIFDPNPTGYQPGRSFRMPIPKYSTDTLLAFGVLKHAASIGLTAGVCAWHGQWMASMGPPDDPFKWIVWKSETPEEAICRCAIKAVDEGVLRPVVNS